MGNARLDDMCSPMHVGVEILNHCIKPPKTGRECILQSCRSQFVQWTAVKYPATHTCATCDILQRGSAEMYRRSGLVMSCEQGMRYDAGFASPVLML